MIRAEPTALHGRTVANKWQAAHSKGQKRMRHGESKAPSWLVPPRAVGMRW